MDATEVTVVTEEDREILSARFELASRYGWMGRCHDAQIALAPHLEPCIKRNVVKVLREWDSYNDMCAFTGKMRAFGVRGSTRELHDMWLATRQVAS